MRSQDVAANIASVFRQTRRRAVECTYPFGLDRRELLKSMIAAPLLAQGPSPAAIASAEAQRQAAGKTAGMTFKALVRHGNELTTER